MVDTPQTAPLPATTGDDTLHRILDLLERSHRRTWMEVACAIILSLATTCSAWCAYQSKIWSGVQGSRSGQASTESRKAAQNRSRAFQIRSLEAAMFIKFFEAKQANNEKLAQFFADRLPPPTKLALLAWWNTNPLDNPQAPSTPFDMAEYKQPQTDAADQEEKNATEIGTTVSEAGHNSDTYVLLTVLFASVLFFGGIGNTFESRRLRRIMIYISIALFLATFAVLVSMPVHWD
ncbi:MAG TPA: hypothetical protein VGY55_06800 [Pirellulales bacterium]|nr:hypothetical protein [Pirellulales bacterium]